MLVSEVFKEHTDQMLEKIYFDIQLQKDEGLVSQLLRPAALKIRGLLSNTSSLGMCFELAEKNLLNEIARRFFTKLNEEPEESGFFVMVGRFGL